MRHWPEINGAVMAQIDLLHHWKNPTHGDGAKPRAITPAGNGAGNGAGTPVARYAPAALCLRRRSRAHRSCRHRGDGQGGMRKRGFELIIGACVLRLEIRELSMPRQIPIPSDGRPVQCQPPRLPIGRGRRRQRRAQAAIATDPADTVQTRSPASDENARIAGLSGIEPCDGKSRERVFARNQAATFTVYLLEEREGQAPGATEALANERAPFPMISRQKDRGGVGVGPIWTARPNIDLPTCIRGRFSRNFFGPACSEKVGWPVKSAALTQRRCGIGQIALAATRERSGAKTHQRAVSESWRGMLP
jgi:hypothetical protein